MRQTINRRGLSLIDVVTVLLVLSVAFTLAVPSLAKLRDASYTDVSVSNLVTQSVAHAMYAADYNGQQYTLWPSDLTTYGNSYETALWNYQHSLGDLSGFDTVAIEIAWTPTGHWYFTAQGVRILHMRQPMGLGAAMDTHFGAFRMMYNVAAFNQYLNGRFYDPVLYAPNDTAVMDLVEPQFELPYLDIPSGLYFSSYISSPAALYHPEVFRAPSEGGWQNPWETSGILGLDTRPLHGAQYADLKTHILEHHWLQNRPDDYCNPLFPNGTYDGCEPYYFNHAMTSAPVTLFYDGHVRLLPNAEVRASDQQVLDQTNGVDGLWSRDTPLGSNGYFNDYSFDNTDLAHHILTTEGIHGRDTLGPLNLRATTTRRKQTATNILD